MSLENVFKAMRRGGWFVVVVCAVAGLSCQPLTLRTQRTVESAPAPVELEGAGASSIDSLFQKWSGRFHSMMPGVEVAYDPVGSGEGVKRFLAGQIDFGATERALTDEEMLRGRGGIQHVPMA